MGSRGGGSGGGGVSRLPSAKPLGGGGAGDGGRGSDETMAEDGNEHGAGARGGSGSGSASVSGTVTPRRMQEIDAVEMGMATPMGDRAVQEEKARGGASVRGQGSKGTREAGREGEGREGERSGQDGDEGVRFI